MLKKYKSYQSIVLLPVQHFSTFVVLLRTFDSSVLGFDETIPIRPLGVLHLHVPLLIGVPLLKTNEFVEIGEHVDENTAVMLPAQKVLDSEVDTAVLLEDVYHLTDDVLEIKI